MELIVIKLKQQSYQAKYFVAFNWLRASETVTMAATVASNDDKTVNMTFRFNTENEPHNNNT